MSNKPMIMKKDVLSRMRGFTLIELLVVLSIIAVLSTIIFAGVAQARVKARDSKRIQEIHQIDLAVQLYIVDHGGAAPTLGSNNCTIAAGSSLTSSSAANCIADFNSANSSSVAAWTLFQADIGKYMPKIPTDACPTCAANLGYVYVAPAVLQYHCVVLSDSTCQRMPTSSSYQLYATMESQGTQSGSNWVGSSFYAPPSPPPYGG